MTREQLLYQLADIVVSLPHSHPQRVAIDGIDAAGKTTLANELVPLFEAQGRPVIRASIDREALDTIEGSLQPKDTMKTRSILLKGPIRVVTL